MKIILTGSLGNIGKPLTKELVQKGHSVTLFGLYEYDNRKERYYRRKLWCRGSFFSLGKEVKLLKEQRFHPMLQGFSGKIDLNGVFWTLGYEISFYFIIVIISALQLWKNLLPIIVG